QAQPTGAASYARPLTRALRARTRPRRHGLRLPRLTLGRDRGSRRLHLEEPGLGGGIDQARAISDVRCAPLVPRLDRQGEHAAAVLAGVEGDGVRGTRGKGHQKVTSVRLRTTTSRKDTLVNPSLVAVTTRRYRSTAWSRAVWIRS